MNRALLQVCAATLVMLAAWGTAMVTLAQTGPGNAGSQGAGQGGPGQAGPTGPGQTGSGKSPGAADGAQASPESPSEPLRLITHTQQYCDQLGSRLASLRRTATVMPPEVATLARDGEKLCAHGQYRLGISRLRRALALLRDASLGPLPDP